MAERVIVIPGVMGSNLFLSRRFLPDEKLWMVAPALLFDAVDKLTLADNGRDMGDGSGRDIYAGSLFYYYYGDLMRRLSSDGFKVYPWAYDWRKDLLDNGAVLATYLASIPAGETVYIVAHSMGGLLTAAAFNALDRSGRTPNVRRVLTLGTPWRGSYAIPRLWSGLDPSYRPLSFFLGVLSAPDLANGRRGALNNALASWPGVYQLAPVPGSDTGYGLVTDETFDPARYKNFNAYLRTSWMERAKAVQPVLASVTRDQARWVRCVGAGWRTASYLRPGADPTDPGSYVNDLNGDSTVPWWSGTAGPTPIVTYTGVSHAELAYHHHVLATVAGLLRNGNTQDLLIGTAT